MQRIALFSITYDPYIGGAEVAIKQVTNRLTECRFDLYTAKMDPNLPDEEQIGNVYVYRVGTGNRLFDKLLFPWGARTMALRQHAKNPYAAFHAVMANYAGLAALLCKRAEPGVPYILTLQSGDSDAFIWSRTWFWYPWYRKIYACADYVTAISNWLVRRACCYGCQKGVAVIPNGVDAGLFSAGISARERERIRESWGANESSNIIFTASRMVRKNGIDILIDSLSHLPETYKLVIAGTGDREKEYKSRSAKYKDQVLFLGQVGYQDLPALMQSADVFARPSRTEGFGNVFVEAMAAKLPVVATPVGGIVDFVTHASTGMLAKPEDPKSVAQQIKIIASDQDLRGRLIQNGADLVRERYSWDRIAGQYKAIYQKCMHV